MVALVSERRVFLWRTALGTKPPEAGATKSVTMDEVICLLEGEWTGGRARVFVSEGSGRILDENDPKADPKNQLYIADIKRDEASQTAAILFNRGDPHTTAAAFLKPAANSLRLEAPKIDETPGWSAHMVVSLQDRDGRYRACFEKMLRVPSSLVELALNRMLRAAVYRNPTYVFEVFEIHGGRRRIRHKQYSPTFVAHRVPSENLMDDLDIGEFHGLTLTRKKTYFDGLGVETYVKWQDEKVVIHTRPVDKSFMPEFIGNILTKAREDGYESVHYDIKKLPGGMSSNPRISLSVEDALEQLYVRAHRLTDFPVLLEHCYTSTCQHLNEKMIALVNDETAW